MQTIINFIEGNPTIFAIALAIVVFAFIGYLSWFRPAHQSTLKAIRAMNTALLEHPSDWQSINDRAYRLLDLFPQLRSSWMETQQRVIELDDKGGKKAVMFGSPRDLWNPSTLLSHRFNLGLADAIPNLLVGVGLFFTFLFLTIALVEATSALGPGQGLDATRDAVSHLLSAAGGKFMTSLAGLLSSLGWTYFAKRQFKALSFACYEFLDTLAKQIPTIGAEVLMQKQAQSLADEVAVSEELLTESREQTGTFKRFETDLAVTLAGAINQAFTPQMEAMTAKLVDSIDGLSEKLGSMNQEALKKMLEDFALMLKKATETEMVQLQQTLSDLAEKLNIAGEKIGDGGAKIGDDLALVGAELVAKVEVISQNLVTGAEGMEKAAESVKVAVNNFRQTMHEAADKGKRGADFVQAALDKSGQTLISLNEITDRINSTSSAFQSVTGKISEVVENVGVLSQEQKAVIAAVREVGPSAQAAIERVASVLEVAGEQTKKSIESAAASLSKTVSTITAGVADYSNQVAELHRQMDGSLAKAVGSFHTHVSELSDSVEELAEIMQSKKA